MEPRLFLEAKKEGFDYKTRKDLSVKPNNNSADFITPNFSHGCEAGCSYCYVARHNTFGNPLTIYDNTLEIIEAVVEHYYCQPPKFPDYSNQQDRWQWVYDIGECTDMLSYNNIELTNFIVKQLIVRTDLKPTFATKLSAPSIVDKIDNIHMVRPYRARIRVSLMPQNIADIVELGTTRIIDRIKSIRSIYEKGYEVHINFSPIILYGTWMEDYIDLMGLVDKEIGNDTLGVAIKQQLKCEIIFLTHHPKLHDSNMRWNPEAERLMWTPDMQEFKVNKRGASDILRYKMDIKKQAVQIIKAIIKQHLPYCTVRYAF